MRKRFLLDTHAYLHLRLEPEKLGAQAKSILLDETAELFLSTASLWEMVIKAAKGKLILPAKTIEGVAVEIRSFEVSLLGIDVADLTALEALPLIHRDPFDRIIVAQAKRHGMTLMTNDEFMRKYDVQHVWN